MMTLAQSVKKYIRHHTPEMFGLLEEMVRIQSGSRNKAGVDRMAERVARALAPCGVSCRTVSQTELGNHLVARTPACDATDTQALLVGHMDTVFPADTPFTGYREDEFHCYGPGVIDMKGGLVAGIFAMKALASAGCLAELPVTFVFNADEEIGSPGSRPVIVQEARKSLFAFVLECGGARGEVVTGRKGNLSMRLDVYGRAEHAAFAGKDKGSAIVELAHKTIAMEQLNRPEKGISANVGLISGGIGPNTVPEQASALVDFRFSAAADLPALRQAVEAIAADRKIPHTRTAVTIVSSRPPMPATPANLQLFDRVRAAAEKLQMTLAAEFRHGVSDANLIAHENIPVIDGLGPLGARDHSEEEYMIKESLPQRAALIACALSHCWKNYN